MEIVAESSLGRFDFSAGTVVTIGVFDGVHAGHRKVIDALNRVREAEGAGSSVLITFDRHPLEVVNPAVSPPLITTLEEKMEILRALDIDIVVIENFTRNIAGMSYRNFISDVLLNKLMARHLVVGYDFHLGHHREGSVERLKEESRRRNFNLTVVPPAVMDEVIISSSNIRNAVRERNFKLANRMLSGYYFLDGRVMAGEGIGRGLDFPTANLEIEEDRKLLPPLGVYAVKVRVNERWYGGMMNAGYSPTFHKDRRKRVEVNIFDFSGELYNRVIRVVPVEFIRDEIKFEYRDKLRRQLQKDREKAIRILMNKEI